MPSPQAQSQRLHGALQVLLYDLSRFFPAHTNEDHRWVHAAIRAAQAVLDEDPDPANSYDSYDATPLPDALAATLRRDAEVFGVAAFRRVVDDELTRPEFERLDPTTIVLTTNRTPEGVTRQLEFSTDTTPDLRTAYDEQVRVNQDLLHNLARLRAALRFQPSADLQAHVRQEDTASGQPRVAGTLHIPEVLVGEHRPTRGSDVEAFIKARRDRYPDESGALGFMWRALDDLLDDYRLRADTGRSLVDNEPTDD